MYDGLYSLRHYVQQKHQTAENLSISIWEVPPGEQGIANFHEHDTIEVAMITAGTGVHVLNAQRAAIQAGDVLLVYPGLRHGYEDCETLGLVNLMYDPAKLPFPILDGGQIPLFRRFFPLHVEPASIPRTPEPILEPQMPYELKGFYNGCVFPTGNVVKDGILYVYYGAADKYVGVATCPLQELLDHLLQNKL